VSALPVGRPPDARARAGRRVTKASEEIDSDIDLGKLQALEGVKEFPSRVKCATLAWHALNSALNNDRSPATTE
jgi:nitrogen fixation NifU-like protein